MGKISKYWFHPGETIGWHKSKPQAARLRLAVQGKHGDVLAAARALQALANVTKDAGTKRAAAADAKVLYARHKKTGR
jgi:hypothetical protein